MATLRLCCCMQAFSSCGKWGLLSSCNCGSWVQLLHGMWTVPRPEIKSMSPALAGEFSTTGLPGKSTQLNTFILAILFCRQSISNQECTLRLLFFSHLEEFLLWGVIQFELSPKLICFAAFFNFMVDFKILDSLGLQRIGHD